MAAIGKMFGGAPKAVAPPKPQPVERMPTPDSPEALAERRRREAARRRAGGRESTMLTGPGSVGYMNTYMGE